MPGRAFDTMDNWTLAEVSKEQGYLCPSHGRETGTKTYPLRRSIENAEANRGISADMANATIANGRRAVGMVPWG